MSKSMNVTDDMGPISGKSISVATALYAGGLTCTSCSTSEPPFVNAYMSPFTHERRHGGTYGSDAAFLPESRSNASCCRETSNAAALMRFASMAASTCFFENHAEATATPNDTSAIAALAMETQFERHMKLILIAKGGE